MSEWVLLYEEALAEVLRYAELMGAAGARERVGLEAARGRVLAEALVADRDQPPFRRSTRDGFAVRSEDLREEGTLRVVGSVRAGERWTGAALGVDEAVEIMTGAPVPEGADAVLMVEHTVVAAGVLRAEAGRRLAAGENVVAVGAEAKEGAVLVEAGRGLGASEIGLAASCGYREVQVWERPRVAIVATGDELVEVGEPMETWQIRNSNGWALETLVAAEGGSAWRLPVAQDTRESLRERLREASGADMVVFSGGVSAGKYDFVEEALREAGAEFVFTGAQIQPGKPVVFGRLPVGDGWRPFFGLPGNPVSTEVCFRLFAAPMLRALCGRTERAPQFAEARLAEAVRGGVGVTRFLPARVESDWQGGWVRVVPWQGSGDMAASARANGFVVLPRRVDSFAAGDVMRVLLK